MRLKSKLFRSIFLGLPAIFVLLAGCGGGNGDFSINSTTNHVRSLRIMQSLSKDTFAPGETASFIYSVVNEGSNTVAVSRYGCEDFAANILQGPKLVKFLGQHSGGCGGSVKTEYLNPGETRAFAATWDLTNEDGSQTPPGEYEATFELKYNFGSPGETNFAPQELIVATPLHFLITAQKKR